MSAITVPNPHAGQFKKGQSGNPAGKKKGTINHNTREVIKRALGDGDTPLEVVLRNMREADERGDVENAVKYAAMAAPYCHPRLQAVSHSDADGSAIVVKIVRFSDVEDAKRRSLTLQAPMQPDPWQTAQAQAFLNKQAAQEQLRLSMMDQTI